MTSYSRDLQLLAACVAALAGYSDALGFLFLKGLFVSFMSGNSTQLGVGLTTTSSAIFPAGLVALFVAGVMLGTTAGRLGGSSRRFMVLGLVTALVTLAAVLAAIATGLSSIIVLTLGMGAANAVFERDGEVHVGVTYMTGTLVKLGQRIVSAVVGEDNFTWLLYLALWASLVGGAFCGALVYSRVGLNGLWLAATAFASLSVASLRMDRRRA